MPAESWLTRSLVCTKNEANAIVTEATVGGSCLQNNNILVRFSGLYFYKLTQHGDIQLIFMFYLQHLLCFSHVILLFCYTVLLSLSLCLFCRREHSSSSNSCRVYSAHSAKNTCCWRSAERRTPQNKIKRRSRERERGRAWENCCAHCALTL